MFEILRETLMVSSVQVADLIEEGNVLVHVKQVKAPAVDEFLHGFLEETSRLFKLSRFEEDEGDQEVASGEVEFL